MKFKIPCELLHLYKREIIIDNIYNFNYTKFSFLHEFE